MSIEWGRRPARILHVLNGSGRTTAGSLPRLLHSPVAVGVLLSLYPHSFTPVTVCVSVCFSCLSVYFLTKHYVPVWYGPYLMLAQTAAYTITSEASWASLSLSLACVRAPSQKPPNLSSLTQYLEHFVLFNVDASAFC